GACPGDRGAAAQGVLVRRSPARRHRAGDARRDGPSRPAEFLQRARVAALGSSRFLHQAMGLLVREALVTRPGPIPTPPRKRTWPFALGVVLLLPLNVFLLAPPESGDGRDAAYMAGYLVGGVLVLLLLVALVYGVARLIRRRSTPPAFVVVAFWTLLTMVVLNAARLGSRGGVTRFHTVVTTAERHA